MEHKYVTLVIKNPSKDRLKTFRLFEETDGVGEISAMSIGHCLDILDDCLSFIDKLADGDINESDIQDEAIKLKHSLQKKYED